MKGSSILLRSTLSKSAGSFSPFVSLFVALVELAIANFNLFYLSTKQSSTTKQAIAGLMFCLSTNLLLAFDQAIVAVVGQGYLFRRRCLSPFLPPFN